MTHDFENPFADYGRIVNGDRFIGRKESLGVVESRVSQARSPANLAIIGQPRIGKSSLVHEALIESREQLIKKDLIPIWVTLSTYDTSGCFFQSLISECLAELILLDSLDESIQYAADRSDPKNFFKAVKKATGFQILLILDEFDDARRLFRDNISDFQKLRELSYQPAFGVTLVTTSRRSIKTIELQTGGISTLSGTFRHHYLGMFNDNDLQTYFDRLTSAGVQISEESKNDILAYCGGYPYLLDMLGCEIVERHQRGQGVNIEKAVDQISQSLFGHYNQIIQLLKEDGSLDGSEKDGSLDGLLQVLFGPVVDVTQGDVNEFLGYGLIEEREKRVYAVSSEGESEEGTYVGFSEHFHDFLRLIERKNGVGDLWPIWRDTEKTLRRFITTIMLDKYGEHWVQKLEKAHPKLKKNPKTKEPGIFEKCRMAQEKDKRLFGNRASQNLLDFTYPRDLFEIIFAEWNSFESRLGKDKSYWDRHAQLLSKVRTPLAHNRDESLRGYEIQTAEGYCNEILEKVS